MTAVAISRLREGLVTASAFRPLADVRDAGSRSKAFDVGFPLESGHCAPTSLMSAIDPTRTFEALVAYPHLKP